MGVCSCVVEIACSGINNRLISQYHPNDIDIEGDALVSTNTSETIAQYGDTVVGVVKCFFRCCFLVNFSSCYAGVMILS